MTYVPKWIISIKKSFKDNLTIALHIFNGNEYIIVLDH